METGDVADYARDHGLDMTPAVIDGDDCVKLLRSGAWVATAQIVTLQLAPSHPTQRHNP